jgi:hypothetical protein
MSVWEAVVVNAEVVERYDALWCDRIRQLLSAYENGLVGVVLRLGERVNYATTKNQRVELGDKEDEPSALNKSQRSAVRSTWKATRATAASGTVVGKQRKP